MRKIRFKFVSTFNQKGLTLIELLVASFLGILLVGVIGSMYITSVSGFRSTGQLSRVQENTRFALHFIQQSLRQAGYSACGSETKDLNFLNNPFNSTVGGGLIGYEFANTAFGDNYDLNYIDLNSKSTQADVDAARIANAGAVADWTSVAGVPGIDDIIARFRPMRGSDVIAVTIEETRNDIVVRGSNNNVVLIEADSPTLPVGAVVKVGNCFERNIYAKTNGATNLNANNGPANIPNASRPSGNTLSKVWDVGDVVFNDVTKIFYIGTGASGLPALYMVESVCGFRTTVAECGDSVSPVELVEGVENMQNMYGIDNDDDNIADQYVTAENVIDFDNVMSLRISLLMRSNEISETTDINRNFTLSDGINIVPIDKGVLRYVINSTVELRSRGE